MVVFRRLAALNITFLLVLYFSCILAKQSNGKSSSSIEEVSDIKDFKKLLRTKNNVLVLFISTMKRANNVVKMFKEAAEVIRGQGTMVLVDCYGEVARKTCKKLKVNPEPFIMKHYKDGDFHRDYDRMLSITSIVSFMRDPTGDAPWEEDASAADVVHIPDMSALSKLIKKETKPLLIMFYAPWCGFCKQLKPEYSDAAKDLRGQAVLAAIDVNRPENSAVRTQYNISGFPTLIYFQGGQLKFTYEGDNKREAMVNFMRDPKPQAAEKPKQEEWSSTPSEVLHLTTDTFEPALKEHGSVLVMFYAPWCGHCKKMKPEYETAAAKMAEQKIPGKLAAVDATKETSLGSQFNIRGYPTVKYFKDGEFAFDANVRDAERIVEFMQEPKEPPPPPPPETPWHEEKSEVVHLNEENFKPFLKKKKHVLVMFYAPWCGHCKKAKPEFGEAAEHYKEDSKVEFAAVDCTAHQSLCSVNEVRGYPTIKYFHYYTKETQAYTGGRTAADFIAFMKDPQNPPAPPTPAPSNPQAEWAGLKGADDILHLTETNFSSELEKRENVLVMFYAPWCGHCKAMKNDYALAAEKVKTQLEDSWLAAVDATVQQGLQKEHGVRGFPTLKLFKKGQFVADYNRARKVDDLVAFMKDPPTSGTKDEL